MSGHGATGGRDEKSEVPRQLLPQHILPHSIPASGFQGTLKPAMANRPIAPAPPTPLRAHLQAHVSMAGAQIVAQPGAQNLLAKLPTVLSNPVEGAVAGGNTLTGQPSAVTMTTGGATLSATPQSITIPAASASSLTQYRPPRPTSPVVLQVPMASIIRGATLSHPAMATAQAASPAAQMSAVAASQAAALTGQPQTISTMSTTQPSSIVHTFPSHIPRGAVAASALAAPKAGALATAVLRQTQPGSIQLPITTNMSVTGASPVIPGTIHAQIPARGLVPVRPGAPTTPPVVTRSGSPAVNIPSMLTGQQSDPAHRQLLSHAAPGNTPATTVQITIQPPKSVAEMNPHPMLSQPPRPLAQPLVQTATLSQQQHKVVMSQPTVSPIITTGNPTVPKLGQFLAGPGGQSYHLSQSLARPQKIVMSQAVPSSAIHTTSLQTITTKTVTASLGAKTQKILVSQASAMAGMQAGSPLVQQQHTKTVGTPSALNVNQSVARQKVMMSQVSMGGVAQPVTPITAITKSPIITVAANHPMPGKRQLPHTSQTGHEFLSREGTTSQTVTLAQPVVPPSTQVTTPTQPGIFVSHRGSPASLPVTAITTSVPTSHTADSRPADRPGVTNFPYTLPPEAAAFANYYPSTLVANYQNLMYQQQVAAAAHAQGFTSISAAGTTIRPGIVASQTPNLAATLQGATVSTAPAGVRINPIPPMMVTVDPRVHTQYTSAPEVKPAASLSDAVSSIAQASSAFTSVGSMPTQGATLSVTANNNLTASPRPSILRKRNNEGITVVKKNLMASGLGGDVISPAGLEALTSSALPQSPKASMLDPTRENSQSSTDTATSTESTPQHMHTPELKIKQEPMDIDKGIDSLAAGSSTPNNNSMEASPRKKPRKQLLNATEELKDGASTDEEVQRISARVDLKKELEKVADTIKKEAELTEYTDDEGVRWVAERKRPHIALLNHYQCTWKPKNNHFLRHSDVKPKEERRPTVNELANQRGVVQKSSGWKLFHLAAQLEEMMDQERDVFKQMSMSQDAIAPKHIAKHTIEDDIGMVHELTQGNIQRCQLVIDQLEEARSSMLKILDHKKRITEIINKHHSKRPVKKKERT